MWNIPFSVCFPTTDHIIFSGELLFYTTTGKYEAIILKSIITRSEMGQETVIMVYLDSYKYFSFIAKSCEKGNEKCRSVQ